MRRTAARARGFYRTCGRAPDLGRLVDVDHTLVFGSCIKPRGRSVRFREWISAAAAPYVAIQVIGTVLYQRMPNGDFWLPSHSSTASWQAREDHARNVSGEFTRAR
jgi:hypothetical protein